MSVSERDHTRIRSHLESYALGIANPELASEIKSHLAECAECREAIEDLGLACLPGETAGEHLPEDMIIQWAQVSSKLRGLERELVRRHIDRCSVCRDNLRMLGHEPELKGIPAQEPSPTELKKLEPQRRPIQGVNPSLMTRLLGAWPVTTWAAAATALLVVVLVNPAFMSRPTGTGTGGPRPAPIPGSDGGHGASAAASPTFLLTTPIEGVALSGGVRSAKQLLPHTIEIGAAQRSLRLFGGPASGIAKDAVVNVAIRGPHGESLGTMTMVHALLWAKDGGVQINSSAPLEPGTYVMQVAAVAPTAASPDTLIYSFELKHAAH